MTNLCATAWEILCIARRHMNPRDHQDRPGLFDECRPLRLLDYCSSIITAIRSRNHSGVCTFFSLRIHFRILGRLCRATNVAVWSIITIDERILCLITSNWCVTLLLSLKYLVIYKDFDCAISREVRKSFWFIKPININR